MEDIYDPEGGVAFTARLLDRDKPGWHWKLVARYGPQLEDLKISNSNMCVLVATHGNYGLGNVEICRGLDLLDRMRVVTATCTVGDELGRRLWLAEVEKRVALQKPETVSSSLEGDFALASA